MSRHHIELPVAGNDSSKTVGLLCGYDRHPYEHFYCNVSESLASDHIDEPLWSSILDEKHDRVTRADGFDTKLADLGIVLPAFIKQALDEDWAAQDMGRVAWWEPNGEPMKEAE